MLEAVAVAAPALGNGTALVDGTDRLQRSGENLRSGN